MGLPERILVVTDSHKDIASSAEVGAWLAAGIRREMPACEVTVLPIADGGEGTIEVLVNAQGGSIEHCTVHDPLYRLRQARLGILADVRRTAVIEIAEASGSAILRPEERDTLVATSFGTGELIRCALERGCGRILVGLGGSIVSDGGMGMAQALGARFYGGDGKLLEPRRSGGFNALSLAEVGRIEFNQQAWRERGVEVVVIADVNTPLLGPAGQARTFGPQKGATEEQIEYIDAGLAHWAGVLEMTFGRAVDVLCAGAAGGLGAGLAAFLDGRLNSGIDFVLSEIGFTDRLEAADTVVTGEGRLDATSLHGKAILAIAARARQAGKRIVGLVGVIAGESDVFDANFDVLIDASAGHDPGFVPSAGECRARMEKAAAAAARRIQEPGDE